VQKYKKMPSGSKFFTFHSSLLPFFIIFAAETDRRINFQTFLNSTIMDYKIIDIEGVGDVYAEKLVAAGINKVSELLEKCAAPKGRKELAEATGISEKLILRWTNHADLFRINGVGPQFSELLEKAGVDTVKEFRHRVAENLQPKLEEINAEFHICGRVPAVAEIQKMIDQAKELEPKMTY
jgi:predicted flap endonuclease-1-like 5' DNA nuclease